MTLLPKASARPAHHRPCHSLMCIWTWAGDPSGTAGTSQSERWAGSGVEDAGVLRGREIDVTRERTWPGQSLCVVWVGLETLDPGLLPTPGVGVPGTPVTFPSISCFPAPSSASGECMSPNKGHMHCPGTDAKRWVPEWGGCKEGVTSSVQSQERGWGHGQKDCRVGSGVRGQGKGAWVTLAGKQRLWIGVRGGDMATA